MPKPSVNGITWTKQGVHTLMGPTQLEYPLLEAEQLLRT